MLVMKMSTMNNLMYLKVCALAELSDPVGNLKFSLSLSPGED